MTDKLEDADKELKKFRLLWNMLYVVLSCLCVCVYLCGIYVQTSTYSLKSLAFVLLASAYHT